MTSTMRERGSAVGGWVIAGMVAATVLFSGVIGVLSDADTEDQMVSDAPRVSRGNSGGEVDDVDVAAENSPAEPVEKKPERKPRPEPEPPALYLVTRVVDGDTLELGNGETVRLIGVDTPEVGDCGAERATQNLVDLAEGERVRLTRPPGTEDRDHYGRLLRYVNFGPKDAGLRLIENGNAIARYDSRDGFGFHPREGSYVAADQETASFTCAPPPPPSPTQQPQQPSCAAGYNPCIPPYPPDLDCADVNGPIHVTGADPHGLDADGDGVACEWG